MVLTRGDCQFCGQLNVYGLLNNPHFICYGCYDEHIEEFYPENMPTGYYEPLDSITDSF